MDKVLPSLKSHTNESLDCVEAVNKDFSGVQPIIGLYVKVPCGPFTFICFVFTSVHPPKVVTVSFAVKLPEKL